ncbi:Origin recognition complex subunit 2 [Coemansia sp. RSA 1813]|nr:Origin recognition complex subunit 2 [Coemansia sp. RSA 1646]KAJ1769810.1 Origin recognition complex subunit 2 [Coemansia sp. RSA 1843]KAJ2091258.1 Origin recognition complex subunit 2 [Coemansia sp. RSA 986]KAJ2216446.1 Origin recognition complex subunit 2 [Coemansia sp. RSA 487]KAJ2571470.1 Origin recognition complex subunit 2 [Coemansia sp. RSA 1813]
MDTPEQRTPRSTIKARSRVDMGFTLTTTKKGRKTQLTDNTNYTPTRGVSEITEILRLGASLDTDDKENSSEEAGGLFSMVGKSVYGFQKRPTRGRGAGASRGTTRGASARGRGARGGRSSSSNPAATPKRARLSKADTARQDNLDYEDEEDEDEDENEAHSQTENRKHADAVDSGNEDGEEDPPHLYGLEDAVEDDFAHGGPAYERYFQDLHSTKGSKTSDNTLSKLPHLSQAECRTILAKTPAKHKEEMELLEGMHRQLFHQWWFELDCGFNLVFYGYGSKRRLLNSFATQMAADAPVVIINGFFPALNLKHSLEKIVTQVIGLGDTTGSVADLASLIYGYFSSSGRSVDSMTLVVHNIDGPCLRKHQASLAVLSSCTSIRLLASIDHIEAPLIWDSSTVTRFNWAWHDLTTFESYTVETSYENFSADTTEIGPRGVLHVLASLTENAKSIFRILAEFQIAESVMDSAPSGAQKSTGPRIPEMPYNSYFAACRDQFLVSNDMTFRSQLTEFRDHKVIQSRHAPDGTEFVHIPLDGTTLGTILESMD